jgi:hypothetical protein
VAFDLSNEDSGDEKTLVGEKKSADGTKTILDLKVGMSKKSPKLIEKVGTLNDEGPPQQQKVRPNPENN